MVEIIVNDGKYLLQKNPTHQLKYIHIFCGDFSPVKVVILVRQI